MVKIKLSREEIEDCVKSKVHDISNFNWGENKNIEVEIDVPLESFITKTVNKIKDIDKKIDKETIIQPKSRNVMTGLRPNLPVI